MDLPFADLERTRSLFFPSSRLWLWQHDYGIFRDVIDRTHYRQLGLLGFHNLSFLVFPRVSQLSVQAPANDL